MFIDMHKPVQNERVNGELIQDGTDANNTQENINVHMK